MIGNLITIMAPTCVFVGTVLRMWDSLAEADEAVSSRRANSREQPGHSAWLGWAILGSNQ